MTGGPALILPVNNKTQCRGIHKNSGARQLQLQWAQTLELPSLQSSVAAYRRIGKEYFYLNACRRESHSHNFITVLTITYTRRDFLLQAQRHLFQLGNLREAMKSGTIHNMTLCVLSHNENKPFLDWYAQTGWLS